MEAMTPNVETMSPNNFGMPYPPKIVCPQCNSPYVSIVPMIVQRPLGVANALIVVPLIFIPILGWVVLFLVIFANRSVSIRQSVCQHCGTAVYLDPAPKPNPIGKILWLAFLGFALMAMIVSIIAASAGS
ncbi:MAG: hypothetical protein FWG24_01880 [Eggerthellaceae bacterium]|nr:hypothetical protein [Eggerthellaceae bacterium]